MKLYSLSLGLLLCLSASSCVKQGASEEPAYTPVVSPPKNNESNENNTPNQKGAIILAGGDLQQRIPQPLPDTLRLAGWMSNADYEYLRDIFDKTHGKAHETVKVLDLSSVETKRMPNSALSGIKVEHLILPRMLTSISSSGLSGTELGKLTMHENLEFLEQVAFERMKLRTPLVFPQGLINIGQAACMGAQMPQVVFPSSLRIISEAAFSGCSALRGRLRLPEGLQEIGAGAFANSFDFQGEPLHIPSSVLRVREGAFKDTKNVGAIVLHSYPPLHGESFSSLLTDEGSLGIMYIKSYKFPNYFTPDAFYPPAGLITRKPQVLYVPKGCKELYESAFRTITSVPPFEGISIFERIEETEEWPSMD